MGSSPILHCGLDISQSGIRAVILQHSHQQIQFKAYFIASSLEELKVYLISHFQVNLPTFRVILAVGEEGLFSQIIESPISLTPEQLDEQVQLVLKQHFSLPVTDFYYDYSIINPQKLWLTAIAKSQIQDTLTWVYGLGVRKVALDVERFALARLKVEAQTYAIIRINKLDLQVIFIIDKLPMLVHRELIASTNIEEILQRIFDQERGLIVKTNIQNFYLIDEGADENLLNNLQKILAIIITPILPFNLIQLDSTQFSNFNFESHQLVLATQLAQWRGHFYDVS